MKAAVAVSLLGVAGGIMLVRSFAFIAMAVTMLLKQEQAKNVGCQTTASHDQDKLWV